MESLRFFPYIFHASVGDSVHPKCPKENIYMSLLCITIKTIIGERPYTILMDYITVYAAHCTRRKILWLKICVWYFQVFPLDLENEIQDLKGQM